MPDGWAWIRQKNLGIALNGKAFKPSDWTKKGLPIVRIQNLNDKNAPYNYYDKDVDETFLLHGGELLFAWSGTPGTSFGAHIWDKGEAVLNQHIFKILFDETIINKIFYKYCLNNQVEKLIEVAHGSAGLAHITKNMFDEVLIPLPPYNEQLRIVTEFEKIISLINYINDNKTELNDTIKQTKSKILDLAIHGKLVSQNPNDEPAEELLKRISTSDNRPYKKLDDEGPFDIPESWAWCKLGEICDYGKCINVNSSDLKADDWILDLEDIEKDSGKIIAFHNFGERKSESTKHKFLKGQVLYSKLRPYLNKVVIAPKDGFCTSEILPLDFKGILLPRYAQVLLMSSYFLEMVNMVTYGVKMPRLGTNDAKNMHIPLPPLAEQQRIFSKIENLFSILDSILVNLE